MGQTTAENSNELLKKVEEEVDAYLDQLQGLNNDDCDVVMKWTASVSARLTALVFMSFDVNNRLWNKLRTDRLQPLHDEVRFQYQVASRRLSLMHHEWELSR